jgi:hypothetical protein
MNAQIIILFLNNRELLTENIDEFCRANPSVIQEYADNCAMYINCSRPGHYITECQYPDLYSPLTKSCQPFKSVKGEYRSGY